MYPLKFNNIYFEKIWGGRDLESFKEDLPKGAIGECWDVCFHPHGISTIKNGKYKGSSLSCVIDIEKEKLLGNKVKCNNFPLLIKFINANAPLSLQVHPDDKYALKIEGCIGKTEVWYIVDAKEDASIVIGTKPCSKEEFLEALRNKNLDNLLNKVTVKKGDVFIIQCGTLHAIGEGIVLAEIQQNCDITYRVYDYDRGRELHINKALDVIDFNSKSYLPKEKIIKKEGFKKTLYEGIEKFSLEKYEISTFLKEESKKHSFSIFTCILGNGKILYKNGEEKINIGESILIPAYLGEYTLKGEMTLLKSYI